MNCPGQNMVGFLPADPPDSVQPVNRSADPESSLPPSGGTGVNSQCPWASKWPSESGHGDSRVSPCRRGQGSPRAGTQGPRAWLSDFRGAELTASFHLTRGWAPLRRAADHLDCEPLPWEGCREWLWHLANQGGWQKLGNCSYQLA